MKKVFYLSAIIILSGFIFTACEKENEDLTKPTIVINEPHEGEAIEPGEELHFEADIADDTELSSYKIDVHNASDGHTHSEAAGILKSIAHEGDTEEFSYLETFTDAAGKKNHHIHQHIDIPENAEEGEYHLTIYVVDKTGNEAHVTRGFVIEHGE
ncbi:MAG: DUF4625 domain-containing protein [Prevotellaceae bacterium]|jgi:hypothetical protein|nr:DUF4625 domain-containing protein [Prevotellaceae bacterium]